MAERWTIHFVGGETIDVDGDVDALISRLDAVPGGWTRVESQPHDRPVWIRVEHVTHISERPSGTASFH